MPPTPAIAAAAEGERAAAGRATDDPAALIDRKRNAATIGIRVLEADTKQGDQRDQSASEQDRNSHALNSLSSQSLRHGRGRFSSLPHDPPRGDLSPSRTEAELTRFLHAIRVLLKARVEGRVHDYRLASLPRKMLGQTGSGFG